MQCDRSHYTFDFWCNYVRTCRLLAVDCGVSIRDLDRALWEYSKVNAIGEDEEEVCLKKRKHRNCAKGPLKKVGFRHYYPTHVPRSHERKVSAVRFTAFHCNGQPAASRNYDASKNRSGFSCWTFLLDPVGTQPNSLLLCRESKRRKGRKSK